MADNSSTLQTKDSSGNRQSVDLARIFVWIFLLGSLFLASPLLFSGLADSIVLRWAATLLPMMLMYLFMRIGRHRVEKHGTVEIEQVADSLYFMGFMFTLVALLVALTQVRSPIDISAIISRFGVAMLTTLVGLLMKVLLTQFKQQGGVTQRQAQADLLRATRRFTRALDSSSAGVEKSVNDASARALEITEKSIADITDQVKSAQVALANNAKAGLELLAEKSKSDMDTLFIHATSNVDALSGQGQNAIRMLADHSKDCQSQLVDGAELISEKLLKVVEDNSDAASAHVVALGTHLDVLQTSVDKVQSRIDTLNTTLDSSVQKHRSVFGPLDRFSNSLADNNDRLSGLHGTLSSFSATGNMLSEGVERLEVAIRRLEESLGNAARVNTFLNLNPDGDTGANSSTKYVGGNQKPEEEGFGLIGDGTLQVGGISEQDEPNKQVDMDYTQTEVEPSTRD